jgi:hypothetical protein
MFDSGTGSHPELPNGWQRPIRFAASQLPRPTPNRSTAIRAYSEHVGSYRHAGGNQGEIAPWYVRINMSAALFSTPTTPGNQPGWPPVHHTPVRTRVPLHVPSYSIALDDRVAMFRYDDHEPGVPLIGRIPEKYVEGPARTPLSGSKHRADLD